MYSIAKNGMLPVPSSVAAARAYAPRRDGSSRHRFLADGFGPNARLRASSWPVRKRAAAPVPRNDPIERNAPGLAGPASRRPDPSLKRMRPADRGRRVRMKARMAMGRSMRPICRSFSPSGPSAPKHSGCLEKGPSESAEVRRRPSIATRPTARPPERTRARRYRPKRTRRIADQMVDSPLFWYNVIVPDGAARRPRNRRQLKG